MIRTSEVMMKEKTLTKIEKLFLLVRELVTNGFSGRVEIHLNRGSIRNIIKIESVEIAD